MIENKIKRKNEKEFVSDFDRGHNKDTDCGLRTAALYSPQLRKSALNNLFSSISLCPYLSFHQVDDTTLQTISTTTFIYNVAIE